MKWGSDRHVRRPSRPSYGRPAPAPTKRRRRLAITINARALVALILAVMVAAWWWQFFRVGRITVEGSLRYPSDRITSEAQHELSHHPLWHNLTTLDTRALRRDLLATQPQESDVAVRRQWPSGLDLVVTERKPNLIWQTGGQAYLLDSQGVIITPAAGGGATRLVTVEDTTGLPVKLGETVVPARFVSFCTDLIALVPKQTGLVVAGLKVPETTSEVYLTTGAGYYIKFDTTRSAAAEVGDLARVLAELKRENKSPAEYIDLRIEGRAYYK